MPVTTEKRRAGPSRPPWARPWASAISEAPSRKTSRPSGAKLSSTSEAFTMTGPPGRRNDPGRGPVLGGHHEAGPGRRQDGQGPEPAVGDGDRGVGLAAPDGPGVVAAQHGLAALFHRRQGQGLRAELDALTADAGHHDLSLHLLPPDGRRLAPIKYQIQNICKLFRHARAPAVAARAPRAQTDAAGADHAPSARGPVTGVRGPAGAWSRGPPSPGPRDARRARRRRCGSSGPTAGRPRSPGRPGPRSPDG